MAKPDQAQPRQTGIRPALDQTVTLTPAGLTYGIRWLIGAGLPSAVASVRQTMGNRVKAVVVDEYDSIDNIQLKDVPLPEVASGQVRIRIGAASIGFVDGLKVQGLYQTKDPLPFIPGTEFAGIVDETAADVSGFARGMPVMGMTRSGALAEFIVVPATALQAEGRPAASESPRFSSANCSAPASLPRLRPRRNEISRGDMAPRPRWIIPNPTGATR